MIFGLFSLFFNFSLGLIISHRWKKFLSIFLIAFLARAILIFYSNYAGDLFDGTADAKKYEDHAWEMSQYGFFNLLEYPGAGGYFISWPIALLYSIFGRNLIIAQSLSLFCGLATVFLGWFIANKLWGEKVATRVGLIISLYPPMVLYSCLVLREAYVYFFLLLAFMGVLNWSRNGGVKYFVLTVISFIAALHYHGAIFIGLIVFIMLAGARALKANYDSLKHGSVNINSLILFLFLILISIYFVLGNVTIPKLGDINEILDFSRIFHMTSHTIRGDASYPEWFIIKEPVELIYKSPLRALYFLVSPLPWDVKKVYHLFGMLDGLFYLYLLVLIFINRKKIISDPGLRNIAIILFSLFILFGWGVGNFGTGLRHRAKFFVSILLLAAPLLPKLIFYRKNVDKLNENLK